MIVLLTINCEATAIVVVHGKGYVIVAADSKAIYIDGHGPATDCKIETLNHGLFAVAGYRTDFKRYSIPDVVKKTFDRKGTFSERVTSTVLALRIAIRDHMNDLKKDDQQFYEHLVNDGGGKVVEVALVDENSIAIRFIGFDKVSHHTKILLSHDCPGKACPKGGVVEVLGQKAAMMKYLKGRNLSDDPQQMATLARTLINVAIEDRKQSPENDVGPPIEELMIDTSGHPKWISNDLNCPLEP
jgi:hypothetical protein